MKIKGFAAKFVQGRARRKVAKTRRLLGLGHVDEGPGSEKGPRVHYTGHLTHLSFWAKGLNINPFFQSHYFSKHALNTQPNVKLDVNVVYKDNYEKEIERLLR